MKRTALLAVPTCAALALIPGCLRDFDQFDASDGAPALGDGDDGGDGGGNGDGGTGGSFGDGDGDTGGVSGDGDGDTGGVSGDGDGDTGGVLGDGDGDTGGGSGDGDGDTGGTVGDGDGDIGGAPGDGDGDGCGIAEKLCGAECVSDNDPATGCGEASCAPCPTPDNATVACEAEACAVGSCEPGFVDCDGEVSSGCEHSPSTFSATACGGCDADCTSLGLSNCQNTCGCATNSDCVGESGGTIECNGNRLCVCDSTICSPGETCVRPQGPPAAVCSCDGGDACQDGWVCCPGASGGYCAQLDGSDSSNCGACGWTCAAGQTCVAGQCQ